NDTAVYECELTNTAINLTSLYVNFTIECSELDCALRCVKSGTCTMSQFNNVTGNCTITNATSVTLYKDINYTTRCGLSMYILFIKQNTTNIKVSAIYMRTSRKH